jgi:uncharacterized protein (TIGR02996 family)
VTPPARAKPPRAKPPRAASEPRDFRAHPLFAEVLARPDDVAPRLVLADRLIELGDPRGEFIQLQCAAEESAERATLDDRAKKLLKKHQPAWLKPFKQHVRYTIFRRGFVDHYLAEPPLVLAGLATVVAHEPVRSLKIQSMKRGDAPEIGKLPALARLARLDVESNRMTTDEGVALFSSPHLASLRELNASRNPFGDLGVVAIVQNLVHLRSLSLGMVGTGASGIAALAAAACVPTLEHLSIHDAEIDAGGFAPLARAPLVALRSLMVWNCSIGDAGALALAASPHLGKLETLRCVGCGIGVEGMRAIARSTTLASLRWFEPGAGDRPPPEVAAELRARFPPRG